MAPEPSGKAPAGMAGTVVKGASMAAGGYAVAQGLNLVVYLVLARLLTPEDFGVYAAATILLGFMGLVSESGITSALIHRKDRIEEAMSTGAAWTLIAGIGLSLVALALSPAIGAFFDNSTTGEIAAVMAGVVLLQTLTSVPSAILQRTFSFRRRMIIEPVQVVVFGGVAIFAAAKGMGAWALVVGQYAGVLVDAVLSWALVSFRPKLRLVSVSMWRELAAYGRHVFAGSLALRIGEQSDTAIVGKFLGEAPLGQFRYAFRLALTPFQMLLSAAAYVLFPAFARITGERERFQAAFVRSLRWMCVLGFPGGLILVPLGVPLAVLLFGDVWREAGYAAMGMGLYTGVMALNSIASEGLKADGRPELAARMNVVGAATTIVAMLALVPLGLSGVAVGVSIGATCGAVVGIRHAARVIEIPMRTVLAEVWPPLVAALAMVAVLTPLEFLVVEADTRGTVVGLLLLALEGAAAAIVYLAVLALLARETLRELGHGARTLRGTLSAAIRRSPDEEALDEAEAPLPGSSVPVSPPELSVVVPAFNAEGTIASTIRSVLAQTGTDFELIVVDDGSERPVEDLVASVAAGDPRVRVIRQDNRGPSAARNAGIRNAEGRLIGLLDSDDLYMPGYLRGVRDALDSAPEAGFAFTDCWILDAPSRRIYRQTGLSTYGFDATRMGADELLGALIAHNFVTASTVTVRREALEALGGYDGSLHGSEDYDLWLRIAASGRGAVRPPGCLVMLRDRPGSQSKRRLMMAANHLEVLQRAGDRFELPAPTRQALDRQIAAQKIAVRGFGGDHDVEALRFRARYRMARIKARLIGPFLWRRRPPPEVTAAFGDVDLL